ncbi:MAG: B12-binding domain-containing radical SAM protein, partial [Armatimonadetes bacterium]|nr:B12-binding domain-containing radical SAM protein [Armatimonadota bacterium]
MKILLIDPPYAIFTGYDSRFFPVGLSYIGAVLKEKGHEVAIYDVDRERDDSGDLNLSEEYARLAQYVREVNDDNHDIWKTMARVIQDHDPDIVGITSMTMKFASVVKTADLSKKVRPDVPVIVGGPHAGDWPEICFQSSSIDFCVSGEGEETISELVEAIGKGQTDFRGIPGVSFRREGAVILREQSPFITDLDRSPYPGRALLLNQDRYSSEDMGVVMTSRGCPYKCGFCSHPPRVRYRNLDQVISEIKDTRDKYGTRQFALKDDSFTVHRKRTVQFCETLIREKLDISWECTTRVNLIDDELLDIMQRANCNTIKVGIETGSERILKEVNKGVTFEQMRKAAGLLNRHGFFWSAYFMYGLPTETRADMMKTLEFMKELNPPYAGLGLYAPMPNTQLWDSGLALGLVDPDIRMAHFFETNPKDYFFKDYRKRVVSMEYDEFVEVAE